MSILVEQILSKASTVSTVSKYATATVAAAVGAGLLYGIIRKPSKWDPKNKGIVITGASSGIGAELAKHYASKGSKLALFARRQAELDAIAKECRALGSPLVVTVTGDVSRDEDCQNLITAAANGFGGVIDCLIVNAGMTMGEYVYNCRDTSIFKRLMEVNYFGAVSSTVPAIPYLTKSEGGGRIIVISSMAGKVGVPTRSGYCATKFALQGFYDSLRIELGPKYGTIITMVCPGAVRTDINRTRLGNPNLKMDFSKAMPLDKAINIIVHAIDTGKREELLTFTNRLAPWLRLLAPKFSDGLIAKSTPVKFEN